MRTSSKYPTSYERALIAEQSRLRGQIIGAYSQSEFLLLDVAIQVRIWKEYWGLGLRYHRKLENRIKQAKLLFGAEGPLKKYEERIGPLLVELEPLKDDRDFLSHAFCRIHTKGEAVSYFYTMIRVDGEHMLRIQKEFSEAEILELERKITDLSQRFVILFSEIYIQEELEIFSGKHTTLPL
tara:strand:+ start:165 stop:710 length:546 start_codon:yes stop_codon:yes gene_type:complete